MKLLFLILFPFISLYAAGPVTHLYLAERYCIIREIQDKKWTEDFIIGSLFPDIRYTSQLSREQTHPSVTHLDEIHHIKNGFEAGMKFHTWVDQVREAFIIDTEIYRDILSYTEGHQATLLKFIEEEILADLYDGRKWSFLFDKVLPEEKAFGITTEDIKQWHIILQYTFYYRLSWLIWGCSYFKNEAFGISNTTLYDWSYLLPELAQQLFFQNHMHKLLEYVESHFKPSVNP